jgi:hypothetical protein
MRRRHVEGEHLDKHRQAGCLALGQLEHESRQGGGVDDRMLERALEASSDEPRVERVVAVLDEHGSLRETQKRTARIAKLRRADEHRPVDVMPAVGVRVDRRLAVHERVKEGEGAVEPEALRADLQDQERSVAGGLDVQRHELRIFQPCLGSDLRRVDRDLFPRHGLHSPARLEVNRLGAQRASAMARRAHSISSLVTPRRSRTPAP